MDFSIGHIYHIYNRGNNSQMVFFTRDNYLYFVEKIRAYILPYADILAWCLMPNHFHLMVSVNQVQIEICERAILSVIEQVTQSHLLNKKTKMEIQFTCIARRFLSARGFRGGFL